MDSIEKESIISAKKKYFRHIILSEIFYSQGLPIAQLAKVLKTSIPSATAVVNELVNEDWLIEIGAGNTKQGRKPTLYSINKNYGVMIAIDINVHDTTFYLLSLQRQVLAKEVLAFNINQPDFVISLTTYLYTKISTLTAKLLGIGISVPGLLESASGINYTYSNLNIGQESLAKYIARALQQQVFVLHDTKATLMGEYYFGLAKGLKHVLLVNIDWGIGLGVLINGEVLEGARGFAGELGHIQVRQNGEMCHCGKTGCLETIASASTLVRQAKEAIKEGKPTKLANNNIEPLDINLELVIDIAKEGDEFAIDLLYDMGNELGKGLSIAVHLFNPEIIIIDGVLAKADTLITTAINQAIYKYCLADFKQDLTIAVSPIGEAAKLFGIQAFILTNIEL
jgi:N-acetylglucosamine repressor